MNEWRAELKDIDFHFICNSTKHQSKLKHFSMEFMRSI